MDVNRFPFLFTFSVDICMQPGNGEKSQTHPTVAGAAFLFSLTSEVLTFWKGIIIFHFILVYSDESKAVFIPLCTEKDGTHLCPAAITHNRGVMQGGLHMNGFLRDRCIHLSDHSFHRLPVLDCCESYGALALLSLPFSPLH